MNLVIVNIIISSFTLLILVLALSYFFGNFYIKLNNVRTTQTRKKTLPKVDKIHNQKGKNRVIIRTEEREREMYDSIKDNEGWR